MRQNILQCQLLRILVCMIGFGAAAEQRAQANPDGGSLPLAAPTSYVLHANSFKHFAEEFNRNDTELYAGGISNTLAWDFLKTNIPLFECPSPDLTEIYYFRWWTYRKHIRNTPAGYVITEFLPPVGWAGAHNTISCAAGHHFHEGRWLSDPKFLNEYSRFWFNGVGEPRRYSFWAAESLWARYLVTADATLVKALLPELITNYEAWEKTHRDTNGLYWQIDDRDGMEVSIGGSGYRATINSYMYGDALAIANIARLSGKPQVAELYSLKAAELKKLVQEKLWDAKAKFFKVLPRRTSASLADVRELHGYTPWYFNLPDPKYAVAWSQLMDPEGFYAPFGPTTAEQRHPGFRIAYDGHECQWNGPGWPFATSITLSGLANLLNSGEQSTISRQQYVDLLQIYAKSHHRVLQNGRSVPWIDENLNPTNGDWISRTLLLKRGSQIPERGKDYNHSTYCDLVITGLVGLRPRADDFLEVNPLAPESWDYFCLDQVRYHGRWITILWDKTGNHYGMGAGLRVLADGKEIAVANSLTRVTASLPKQK